MNMRHRNAQNALMVLIVSVVIGASASDWEEPGDIPLPAPLNVGLAGAEPTDITRFLLAQGAISAAPSPDGKQLAFRWSVTGEPQLWVTPTEGGWPRQLTFGSGMTFFEWSPMGEHLLVGRDTEGDEREGYYLLSDDGRTEREVLPPSDAFRQFGMFSPDGQRILYSSTERNGRDFDIYLADVTSGETRMVFRGEFGFFPLAWQPGGSLVLVSETRGEDANDVHLLDLEDGRITPLFQPEVSAAFTDFQWLPDGSGFYYATNIDREFMALAYYSLAERAFTLLETPEYDIERPRLTRDGRFLSWLTNENGYSRLHATDLASGKQLAPPTLPAGVYDIAFATHAPVLSILIDGVTTPGDVYAWNLASGATSQPVRANLAGLDTQQFSTPRPLTYHARDGVTLHGLLYQPDPAKHPGKRPLVVQVHGGPTSQSRPRFRRSEQHLVSQGIAVFSVNVRGSTGYGKTYARLDNQEKRLDSVRDLVDTVGFLSGEWLIDTHRAAVMGASYGGYMVNAVLGAYPGVFKAGVSAVGVSDWVRALQEASPALQASDRIEYGDIREERWQAFYAENSPIHQAKNIDVPMLFSHGANDPRDPVTESDRMVREVRSHGVEVRYLRFPDEGHQIRKLENRVAYHSAVAEFLTQNLAAPANASPKPSQE